MTSFESIFASNTNTKQNLDALFKNAKNKPNPDSSTILNSINNVEDSTTKQESPVETSEIKSSRNRKKVKKFDPQTELRTVFVGNLPNTTKKGDLEKIFKSYGKIETIRFRNIVPEDLTKSKKYAFITHQTHPNKQTINAYIRFISDESATNALQLNGTEFRSHHIRVDLATNNKVHDNKRSVFLGGLPFSITEESIFEHFKECGEIENVRLIRDNQNGIGKGIGYIAFKTADTINLALKLDKSELDGRRIRVQRCSKKPKKKGLAKNQGKNQNTKKGDYNNNNNKRKFNNDSKEKSNEKQSIKRFKSDNNKKNKKFKKSRNPLKNIKTNKRPTTKLKI